MIQSALIGNYKLTLGSLKGKDYIFNEVLGVGGRTGGDSGVVSSPVAGGLMTIHGYAGIAVFNPYRSFILKQKEY